ncbi:hypothetical protein BRADI_1g56896v3 [Brachypodium distachyon]|uniref:Knottins-like domain-containing protein n=1 Tax=Brachypodium distachyon TaxID=15368 RepID=I1H3K0_BRADI|nr:hypothetical protein BRADI_1g56896v3 [Brachypodium distachyon]
MDLSMKVFVIVLLVLVTTENMGLVQVALARDCETASHKFHGPCVRDSNCASVCETGFHRGQVWGLSPLFLQQAVLDDLPFFMHTWSHVINP